MSHEPSNTQILDELQSLRSRELATLSGSMAVVVQQINVHERRIASVERETEVARGIAANERGMIRSELEHTRRRFEEFVTAEFQPGRRELLLQQQELLRLNEKQSEVIGKLERFVLSGTYTDEAGEERMGLLKVARRMDEHLRWYRRIWRGTAWVASGLLATAISVITLAKMLGWW